MPKMHFLNLEQQFAVVKYLREHIGELLERRPDLETFSAEASEALGFKITPPNIKTVQRSFPDLKWSRASRGGVAAFMSHTKRTQKTIARCVADLYDSIGKPVPSELKTLIIGAEHDVEATT